MDIPLKIPFICLQLEVENRILGEYNNYNKLHCKNRIVKVLVSKVARMQIIF